MATKEIFPGVSNPLKTDELISVFLEEDGYVAKDLTGDEEIYQTFKLRKKIFCDELGWVKPLGDLEIDEFDTFSVPFGVFNNNRLEAYLRLIPTVHPFMLEKIFPMLISPEHSLKKDMATGEITRLCIEPDARKSCLRNDFGAFGLSLFLYKSVYHWCIANNVRYLYLVVEYKIFRLLNAQGIICGKIGEPTVMPDGVKAVAAMIDWRNVEEVNARIRPKMNDWFTGYLSVSAQKPRPLPAASKLHQAYV